ncbi:MAG TPA: ComEC/Rec2 family competence protein [Patescibacteria group bacterium]|nr:ComEC/Rec2 family competence protein [Patescibacteria group bacterium]
MTPFSVSGLTSIINQLLPEPHASLLAGLLFGTKTSLPRDLYESLITTGTIHIAALSGQNLSILSTMISDRLVWIIGKRGASAITLLLIVWFVSFVGPSPSIVRAAIMTGLTMIATVFGRQYWALLSWMLAVGIMLVLNFSWISEISFQLSALATLGIILFSRKEKNIITNELRLTLAAQSLTIPLILFHFRRISLIAPLSNLAIGWSVPWITGLGWVMAIIGWMWLPLGQVIAWVDWVLLEYLIRAVRLMSGVPYASIGQ